MPKRAALQPHEELTNRQKNVLFAVIKEYCEFGEGLGSSELREKYGFDFSSATIRNEFVQLRNKGYLYQPFVNSGSVPTDKAFRLFINQLLLGLQVTSRQQRELKKQIEEMHQKQARLEKEISRLLALQSGAVGFSVNQQRESVSGISNLLIEPTEGRVSDVLDFLDNLDRYKQFLLTSNEVEIGELQTEEQISQDAPAIKTIIGTENPVLPLGKGYAMVTAEVMLDGEEKSIVGLVTPMRLLGKKKNLQLLEGLSQVLGGRQEGGNLPKNDDSRGGSIPPF
jgi:transcriptional regulator of heat shock response